MKTNANVLMTAAFLTAAMSSFSQPVIVTQPQGRTNVAGTTLMLSVEATGAPPLRYQWRRSASTLAGETNATLVITNIQTSHQGNYSVVVTNLDGAATSAFAFVRVIGPPGISTQPADRFAVWGDAPLFQVVATGTAPLFYQWHFNGIPLPGQTNTSLALTNVTFSNAGPYFVVISNLASGTTSRVATLDVPAPEVLDAKLSANIRLGDDPPQLPAGRRAQAEPHLARSFTDPSLLVAIFQEGRFGDGGGAAAACGYSVSRDGGLTWSRALIPGLTTVSGGTFVRASDPVAAIDLHGNVLLNTLPNNGGSPSGVAVSISTNHGATFSAPILVDRAVSGQFHDKNWIVVNTLPGTPHPNRVLVTYSERPTRLDLQRVFSDDGGRTWSPPRTISPTNSYGGQPMFLPDGSVAVVYTRYPNGIDSAVDCEVEMVRSSDGGDNFGAPVKVTFGKFSGYSDPVARTAVADTSAVCDRQAGVIYVTYQALIGSAPNLTPSILFTWSIDRGLTWSTPVAVNDTPNRGGVFNPCVAVSPDGQHVTIGFYDKRHNTATTSGNLVDYYLAESFDGGETWGPNLRLSDVSSDLRLAPLTADGRMFADYQGIVPALNSNVPGVAVWIDTRTGNPDPFVVRIQRTKGTTFETWRKLRYSPNDLANLAISGEGADPDGDGIANLAEYAFGLEPNHADRSQLTLARSGDPETRSVLFHQRLALLTDVEFIWERSADLASWEPVIPISQSFDLSGADPSITKVITVIRDNPYPNAFFRLAVRQSATVPRVGQNALR